MLYINTTHIRGFLETRRGERHTDDLGDPRAEKSHRGARRPHEGAGGSSPIIGRHSPTRNRNSQATSQQRTKVTINNYVHGHGHNKPGVAILQESRAFSTGKENGLPLPVEDVSFIDSENQLHVIQVPYVFSALDFLVNDASESIKLTGESPFDFRNKLHLELTSLSRFAQAKIAKQVTEEIKLNGEYNGATLSNKIFEDEIIAKITKRGPITESLKALIAFYMLKGVDETPKKLHAFPKGFFDKNTVEKVQIIMRHYLIDLKGINRASDLEKLENLREMMINDGLGEILDRFKTTEDLLRLTFPGFIGHDTSALCRLHASNRVSMLSAMPAFVAVAKNRDIVETNLQGTNTTTPINFEVTVNLPPELSCEQQPTNTLLADIFSQHPITISNLRKGELENMGSGERNARNMELAKIRVIGDKARDDLTTTVTSVLDIYGNNLTAEQKKEAAEYSLRKDQTIQLLRSSRKLDQSEFYNQCVGKILEACKKYFLSKDPPIEAELKNNPTNRTRAIKILQKDNSLYKLIELSRGLSAVENLVAENTGIACIVVENEFGWCFRKHKELVNEELREQLINAGIDRPDGLFGAAKGFDPSQGWEFSIFAYACIRNAVFDELDDLLPKLQLSAIDKRRLRAILLARKNKEALRDVPKHTVDELREASKMKTNHFSTLYIENDDGKLLALADILPDKPSTDSSLRPSQHYAVFWAQPIEIRRALIRLEKERPTYRLVLELYYSGMSEQEILDIGRELFGKKFTPRLINSAIPKSLHRVKELTQNPIDTGKELVNGSQTPINEFINALKEHPEWALLIFNSEAYMLSRLYSFEDTYMNNSFDSLRSTNEIGRQMPNKITGKEGISSARAHTILNNGRQKIINLMKMVATNGNDFDSTSITISKELLSVIKMCGVFPFPVSDTVDTKKHSAIINIVTHNSTISSKRIASDLNIPVDDVNNFISNYVVEQIVTEGKLLKEINTTPGGTAYIRRIFNKAREQIIRATFLNSEKRTQLLNLLIHEPPKTDEIKTLQESSLFKRLVEVNKSEAERRSENEMALAG